MKILTKIFILGFFSLYMPLAVNATTIEEVKNYVNENFKGTIPSNLGELSTIEEIENALDPYSTYFTQEEYNEYINSIDRQMVGIGVVLQEHEKGLVILETLLNGSAQKVGIKPGYVITGINGVSMLGKSVQEAISLISGTEGNSITLEFIDLGGNKSNVQVTREVVSVPTVEFKNLYGDIGYIRVTSFSHDAGKHFGDSIKSLKEAGVKSFIVDLRNNGGGFVSSAKDIIGYFPNSPNAYHMYYKNSDEIGKSTVQPFSLGMNAKLLINSYSASASEMTAAAVKDQSSATLYGQKSFGKGSMQSFMPISNGDQLKLTVAEFTGPNGTQVNKTGVIPDIATVKGMELVQAHLDILEESLVDYKKLNSLSNVPLDKKFKVSFSQMMSKSVATNFLELVELGGNSVPYTIERAGLKTFEITPKSFLKKGKKYLLIIHPKFQNINNMQMTKGAYLEVTTYTP